MSWLGGLNDSFTQLSSLTGQLGGQISNFTKEVLTEGTEDNVDYEIEAKKLQQQLKQNEAHSQEKDTLVLQLRQENTLLKEKVHKAELHVSTSGIEYEANLRQKTKEIALLKQKLSKYGDDLNEDVSPRPTGGPVISSSFSSISLNDDDESFHEIIGYQQEIDRLNQELVETQTQRESWKEKFNALKDSQASDDLRQNTDAVLINRVKELEEVLQREAKHHQQELSVMQDSHAASLQRYQEEIKKLKLNQSSSPALDAQANSSPADDVTMRNHREEVKKVQSELEMLKEQLRTRNRQLQAQKKQLEELDVSCKDHEKEAEKYKSDMKILEEKIKDVKSKNHKLESDFEEHRKWRLDVIEGVRELIDGTGIQGATVNEANVLGALLDAKEHCLHLVADHNEMEGIDHQREQQDESMRDTELAESDQWHQDRLRQNPEEDQNSVPSAAESDQHQGRCLPLHLEFGSPANHSSPRMHPGHSRILSENPQEHRTQGDLTLTLQALEKQVEDYELEIEQYEQVQSEWQTEKKTLQDLLNRYQNEVASSDEQRSTDEPEDERTATVVKLRKELEELREAREALEKETTRLVQEKEQLQVATKNLEEELNSSISETQIERGQVDVLKNELTKNAKEKDKLQAAVENITQELNRSRMEKNELDEALNALDSQHQDEMAQLLVVRDELKQQLKNAQSQIKQENETNCELSKELESLKTAEETLRSSSEASHDLEREIGVLREEVSEAKKTKSELRTKLAETAAELKLVMGKSEKCFSLNEELRHNIAKAINEKATAESEYEKLKEIKEKAETALQTEISNLRDENKKILGSNNDLKRKFEMEMKEREERMNLKLREKNVIIEDLQNGQERSDKSQIQSLENEVGKLQTMLEKKDAEVEDAVREKQKCEEKVTSEAVRFREELESLGLELENSGKEMAQTQSAHQAEIQKLHQANKDFIRKMQEDSERKFGDLLEDHARYKMETDTTTKVYVEKISHLEKSNHNLQKQLEDVGNRMRQDNNELVENLQEQNSDLSQKYKSLMNEHNILKADKRTEKEALENDLKQEIELKMQAQKEVQRIKGSEMTLSSELASSREHLRVLTEKLQNQANLVSDKNSSDDAERFSKELQQVRNAYDSKVKSLLSETEELKRQLASRNTPSRSADLDVDELLEEIRRRDIGDLEKADLSKEDIGSLLRLIRERDEVISLLTQQRATSGQSSSASFAAIKELEDANRALTAEKDQILAVISEKTRENKKLKDETHKMMNVVAEGKSALAKVQQENSALVAKYEGYDKEMTKEAVAKLSRLVMEKELEIESLKQKCGTLLEVLQQQSPGGGSVSSDTLVSGEQVQSLLKDKEVLTQQVQQLLTERNHLVALLNQQQVEAEQVRAEVTKAAEALERDSDNNSKLQISFGNLVHEYEQTQMKLSSVQKELLYFKEKLNHLEEMKDTVLTKIEVLETSDDSHPVSADTNSLVTASEQDVTVLQAKIERSTESLLRKNILLQKSTEDSLEKDAEIARLLNDSREKDLLIHSRTEEMTRAKKELATRSNEVEILRKSVENLREQVAGLTRDCEERRTEVRTISGRLEEKEAESQAFQETNAQLSMMLKEKEYEIENANDKSKRLESMVKENQQGKDTESQRLLAELDQSKQSLIAARQERDQVMLSSKQRKMEADRYSEEARILREKETKLESELVRLRNHLIQVEEAYTQEAMLAEDREKGLREQLQLTRSTNSAAREASEQSQQQAESLQEQLRTALGQRDQAIQQRQLAQEQGIQYATALQKLQLAVERMQREEAATFSEQLDRVKTQLEQRNNDANAFESQVEDLKAKLKNSKEALKSASRLNKQLELKEQNIEQLKNLVAEKQLHIDDLQDRIHVISSKNEAMVDKEILKNLIIGYFTTPANKRHDVLHLITGVLGFSSEEVSKVESGGSQGGKRGWIGGWLWRGSGSQSSSSVSAPNSPRSSNSDQSFTQMFVKFLENESVPHQTARLPAATMINEAQQRINQRRMVGSPAISSVPTPVGTTASERAAPIVAGRYSPFLLTNPAMSTPARGHDQAPAHGPTVQPLVMHPITPMLPTFSPIPNPKPSAEQEIMQDILLSNGER